jgi:hypothetical protein
MIPSLGAPATTARPRQGEAAGRLPTRPLRIAFLARHVGYLRNFDTVLAELARRGHHLDVAFQLDEGAAPGERVLMEDLGRAHPSIRFHPPPVPLRDIWWVLREMIRRSIDYLRYLDPRYDRAPILRSRSVKRTPWGLTALGRLLAGQPRLTARLLVGLKRVEREIPFSPTIERLLVDLRPDVVLFTPLIDLGSHQLDHLMAAQALGLRTVLCVMSWDHLSSKSVIRVLPDLVTVWNATQKREAMELHGVPEERIAVTGAQCFDAWFGRTPSRSREDFCHRAGLDPARPFILYVCSSLMLGSPPESDFVLRWIKHVRAHPDPALREAGILVRPHPKRSEEWSRGEFARLPNVAVWPRARAFPVGAEARGDFFDSMSHSALIVGINTSALIEGGIVGRPVHTLLLPEFRDNQEGTLHFHYLLGANGGLLHVATSFEEHLAQLAASLAGGGRADGRNARFVEAFVRPHGLRVPATPVFCDVIEGVVLRPAALGEHPRRARYPLRAGLFLAAVVALVAFKGKRVASSVATGFETTIRARGLARGVARASWRGARVALVRLLGTR